jgi:hypothetical protein
MGWVVNATPRPLYPWKETDTHCIGGWGGPGPVWMGVENLAPPPPGFYPRTIHPVASRDTD